MPCVVHTICPWLHMPVPGHVTPWASCVTSQPHLIHGCTPTHSHASPMPLSTAVHTHACLCMPTPSSMHAHAFIHGCMPYSTHAHTAHTLPMIVPSCFTCLNLAPVHPCMHTPAHACTFPHPQLYMCMPRPLPCTLFHAVHAHTPIHACP